MGLAQKQTSGSVEQNREPRNKPRHLGQSLTKEARVYSGEKTVSLASGIGKARQIVTYKSVKLEHFLTQYTKINSKWLKDLNIKEGHPKTLRTQAKHSLTLSCSNVFLGQSSIAMEIKAKTNRWN